MSLTNTEKWQYTAWLIDWLYTFFLLFHSYSIWKLSVHVKGCIIKTSTFKQACNILLLCLPRPIMIRGSEVIHNFSAIFVTNNLVYSLEEKSLLNYSPDANAQCCSKNLITRWFTTGQYMTIMIIIDLAPIPIRLNDAR